MNEVTINSRNELAQILEQRRAMIPLTMSELAAKSGVSTSYLSRIKKGERFPSAGVLRRIVKALDLDETWLFTQVGYLSPSEALPAGSETAPKRLDPYVAMVLSQEPIEVQRTVIALLTLLKSICKGIGCNMGFAEYIHKNYPEVDEDTITMVEDVILVATRRPQKDQPADSSTP